MSFVRALATLAVGFAAAKGMQKVKEMGGVDALRDKMRNAGQPGGMADNIGAMAQKMGLPVQTEQLRGMFDSFGKSAAGASESAEAGLGQMMGTAKAGAGALGGMIGAMTAGSPMGGISEETARLMIRAMIQAAKADGKIDDIERKAILDQMDGSSDEEVAFVEAELAAPVDPAALAADTAESMRAQVYSAALMAIAVDTDAERAYLRHLASALMLDAGKVAAIHAGMGKPVV
jgi:uncharacterized membrane protein YebE (DUF533 family)